MTKRQWENKVLQHIRECRGHVSYFWFDNHPTLYCALDRLVKRGRLRIRVLGFPMWKITERKERDQ